MNITPFAQYRDLYAEHGVAVIVGKGPTNYDFARLREWKCPVLFINEAVRSAPLARNAAARFFFAHDKRQAGLLVEPCMIPCVAVLPSGETMDSHGDATMLTLDELTAVPVPVCPYTWDNSWLAPVLTQPQFGRLGRVTKESLAENANLFLRCSTTHTAIHFAWYSGAKTIVFIGCRGTPGYDRRAPMVGPATPTTYKNIRYWQDKELEVLGLRAEYVEDKVCVSP